MNFQTLHKQRKFVLFASFAGIISVFLPWISISFMGNTVQSISGFRGYGIAAFFCFVVAGAMAIMGDQLRPLDKQNWLICLTTGVLALLFTVITFGDGQQDMIVAAGSHGVGIWLALGASICIILFSWIYRNPSNNIKDSFDSIKKSISIPSTMVSKPATSSNDRIAELERLSRLKDNGSITEEEFLQLKSKVL